MRHFKTKTKVFISLIMCFCMIATILGTNGLSFISTKAASSALNDTRLHFMIRHWHHDVKTDGDNSELIEGYIAKQEDGGGSTSFSLQDSSGDQLKNGDERELAAIGLAFNEKTGTVTVKPIIKKDSNDIALEEFAGFTISAGPDAINEYLSDSGDEDSPCLKITYNEEVHTVKAHVFYTETVMATGEDMGDASLETDTKIEGDEKIYNTAAGLHTDKTAYEVSETREGAAGRTFDLELESWFAGENLLDTGLVLDASGSMAFTSVDMDSKSEVMISDKMIDALEDEGIGAGDRIPEEYVDAILDKNYTDNSKLSYSGYNYFIYDPRSATQEYVPLAYWDGKNKETVKIIEELPQTNLLGYYSFDEGELKNDLTGDDAGVAVANPYDTENQYSVTDSVKLEAWVSSNKGVNNSGALDVTKLTTDSRNTYKGNSGVSYLLNAKPKSTEFTISFAARFSSTDQLDKPTYFMSIFDDNGVCYELYRKSKSQELHLDVFSDKSANKGSTDLKMVTGFPDANIHTYTLVFKDNKVTLYIDGTKDRDYTLTKTLDPDSIGITIGGPRVGQNQYNGNNHLFMDDIYIYDIALDESSVKTLVNPEENAESVVVALDDDNNVLGIIDDDAASASAENLTGWYYLTSDSAWQHYSDPKIQTAKMLHGIPKPDRDQVLSGGKVTKYLKNDDGETIFYSTDVTDPEAQKNDPSNHCHMVDDYSSSYFYYKDGGDGSDQALYCAYYATSRTYETSPVYKVSDLSRIKEENLQAAVGDFVVKLHEKSSNSRVAAVRFSTDSIMEDDYDKLVMLDWTMDPIEATNMLGLQWGSGDEAGTSIGSTASNPSENLVQDKAPIQQYNYGLTGGTHTWVGLQAYIDELDDRIVRSNDDAGNPQIAEKYLIIFTDGKDDDEFKDGSGTEKKGEAEKLASQLKDEDYTIYCVMLTGGTLSDETGIRETEDYLAKLSGNAEYEPKRDEKSDKYQYVFTAKDASELQSSFEEIVNQIYFSLKEYTVQDYIDSRFDLVDIDGNTIHLNADGEISITDEDGKDVNFEIKDKNGNVTAGKSLDAENYYEYNCRSKYEEAQTAHLYYDAENQMFYLRWLNQEIPGCSIGAKELSVWRATITVRAKEDFIGGNAVLTNGNQENMNIVYAQAEETIIEESGNKKSSGTDDMYMKDPDNPDDPHKPNDEYPSKGFPRTTVDVKLLDFDVEGGKQTIYLGENIVPSDILKELGESIKTEIKDSDETVYWDYLTRYVNYDTEDEFDTLDQLLEDIAEGLLEKGTYSIDYTYLPNEDESNQTGTKAHEKDVLGELVFTWEAVEPEDISTNKTYEAIDTEDKTYQLTVEYIAYPEKMETGHSSDSVGRDSLLVGTKESSGSYTGGMIAEDAYHTPKDPVGEEQTEIEKSGTHTTDIVKGEIHLDMHLKKEDLLYLKQHYSGKITYCANVNRTYSNGGKAAVPETIGTLTATFDLDAWDPESGVDDIYIHDADFKPTPEYADIYDDEHLPIGTYTLTPKEDEITSPVPFVFGDIEIVEITSEHDEHFDLLPGIKQEASETAEDYAAEIDATSFYLGTAKSTRPADYLNDRLGLALIEGSLALGDLKITKKVGGVVTDEPEEDPDFTFAVQLLETKPEANADGVPLVGSYAYTVYDEDGNKVKSEAGNTEIAHGETFTLKAGQSVVIEDLPKGAYYEVTEVKTDMPGGYTPEDETYLKTGTITGKTDKTGKIIADEVTFTNDYAATVTLKDSLLVKKVFNREWRDGDSFTFTLTPDEAVKTAIENKEVEIEGYDEDAGTASITITDKDASDYTKAFGKMTFHSNGKKTTDYTFTVAETKGSEPGVGYADNSYTVTLRVTDNEDGTMVVELVQDGTAKEIDEKNPFEMEFENTYTVTPTTQVLSVKKNITGDVPEGKDYTFDFTLSTNEKSGMTMPKEDTVQVTVNSKATTATADFGAITFTRAGTYEFEISENTEDPIQGFVYDSDSWTAKVVVTEEIDKTTKAVSLKVESVTYTRDVETETDAAVFTNQYDPGTAVYAPQVTKAITGEVPSADSAFTFTIADTGASAGVKMPAKKNVTVTGAGSAEFGNITFSKAGTYTFTITEEDGGLTGYTYDDQPWTLTVKVADNDGKLEIETVSYTRDTETTEDSAEFTNIYQPEETTFAPSVEKEIDGLTPPSAGTFTFEISTSNNTDAGVTMPAKKNVTVTGAGSAEFDDITFSKAGTYTFTITEEAGKLAGYTYDDSEWTLTVEVTDVDGKLQVSEASYTKGTGASAQTETDAAVFTNTYQPEETTFAPSVEKEIDGLTPPSAGTFTFEISTSNNTDAGVTMPAKKNVTVTGAGSAEFDDITFSKAGTYTFTITEEAGKLAGYTYDDSEWTLTVEVTDVDGKLQVSEASYTKGTGASAQTETDAAVFTNIYTPGDAVYVPQVTKAITGGTPPTIDTDIFTFTLTESAADLDKVLAEPLTAEVTGEGTASFDALTFTKAGTYSFTITEEDDALPGYTYDTAEWTLTVTVVDQDGKLQVDEDRTSYQKTVAGGQTVSELEAAVFENDYEAEGTEYAPRVEKDITGDKPTDNKTFTFTLAADAENPEGAALPNNKTLKIKGADSGVFDEITFTKAGTYKFTITEQDDALPGYTYDTNEWTLTVVVEDIASELIVESAAYVQDGATTEYDWATFTNTYKLTPVTYRAEVQKTVEGDVPEDQTFTFTMTAKDDNPKSGASLKPGEQLTITVVGSGKGLFDAIEFTRPGTYCYEIREHRDDLSGYTYDGTVWTMKVEVTDRDSQLETKVTYTDHTGQTADLAGFLNIYRADPVGVTPNVEKKINGNLSSAQKDFTFTLEFAEGDESGVQLPEVTSVTRTGVGTTAFDEIIFTKAGTYLFDIKEELEHIPGYTFDPSTWQLKVVVTDHGGVLGADASYTNLETGEERSQEAVFTNIYQTLSVGFEPKVIKTVIGDVPKDETFTFILLADPDNPEGAELPQETEVTITGSGETLFGDITFTEPGTYVFEIDEEQGNVSGYTYDDNAWTLTIEVIDVDGQLEVAAAVYERADEEPNETAAHFENSYRPERTAYAPVIEKVISGDTPETPTEFTFELQADPENETGAVLPAVRTVTVTDEGTAEFENIIFTKAGTYTFEVRETAGDVAGYTYDDSVWTLTVEVEDRNAALDVTKVTYTKNGANESSDTLALFENIFDEFDEPDEPSTDNEIVEPPTEPDTTDDSTTSEPPTTPDVPTDSNTTSKTGDSMNPILWVLIMILALLAAGATVFYRRRNRL